MQGDNEVKDRFAVDLLDCSFNSFKILEYWYQPYEECEMYHLQVT